jgi:S1-C subfamily serine protease
LPPFDGLPDDLQDEEEYYSDSIADPDCPESDEGSSSLSNLGRRNKRALILSTIGIVFVLWIASLFNGDADQDAPPGKRLTLAGENTNTVEGGPVNPNPEPIKTRPEPQNGNGAVLTPKQIFQKAKPSTVMVVVRDSLGEETAFGSGFFVDRRTIVSNFHVVEGAYSGYVRSIGTQKRYEIEGFTAMNKKLDLVVFRVDAAPFPLLPRRGWPTRQL